MCHKRASCIRILDLSKRAVLRVCLCVETETRLASSVQYSRALSTLRCRERSSFNQTFSEFRACCICISMVLPWMFTAFVSLLSFEAFYSNDNNQRSFPTIKLFRIDRRLRLGLSVLALHKKACSNYHNERG